MRPVRFLARLSGVLLAVLLLPVAVGVAGTRASLASLYQPRQDTVTVAATPPAHDPAKATAAILIGPQGANAADTLGPYQILATTGAINLYTVAPERRPLPLTGGLDLVPDLTFAELDRRLGPTGAADVVIVPDMPKIEPVVAWLQQQRQRHEAHGTVLLSVCYGAKVLAKAGLLDGRDATSSWLGSSWLARRYPAVTWHHGTRYVEDANGVLLTDGVGELELASAFSPYTEQSYAARTLGLGTSQAVRTAHGLTFVPRASLRGAGDRVDRLIVPVSEAARRRNPRLVALGRAEGFTPIYLHERPGFAYDAALRDIARTFDASTARHAAKRLEYPVAAADLAVSACRRRFSCARSFSAWPGSRSPSGSTGCYERAGTAGGP